jgi:hypothetical protein
MNKGKVSIFAERLGKMQAAANEAMSGYTPGGIRVPDSIYMARVQAELKEAQSSGNLMIGRTFTIVDGEFKGLKIWDNIVLEQLDGDGNHTLSDRGIQNARRWVESHGIAFPEDISQLEAIVNQINDAAPLCQVRSITTKKGDDEYTNVRVMKVLDETGGEVAAVEATASVAESAEAQSADQDVLDGMNRVALKAFITENQLSATVKVSIKDTDEVIRDKIRSAVAATQEETPAEEAAAPAEEVAPAYDATTLLAFCASQQITEVEEGMEPTQIIEIMKTYQYKKAELSPDEVTMLTTIGIPESNIIQPPAPPAKPAAPKPVAPKPITPKPVAPKAVAPVAVPKLGVPKLGAPKPGMLKPGLKK